MTTIRGILLLSCLLPVLAAAALDDADIPPGTMWYVHADLAGMRASDTGRDLYDWFEDEVVSEVRNETGVDISEEIDRVTAYAHAESGVVIVAEGAIQQATRDKLLAMLSMEARTDLREHAGHQYFFVGEHEARAGGMQRLDDLDESAYLSLDLPGKVLIASREDVMRGLLQNGGYIAGAGGHGGALLVLTADKSFVQAGLRAEDFVDDDDRGWNSNILRSTEQAAFLLAERGGRLALEAQLKSNDARLTQSLGSIINGVISLQAFNDDLEPELRELIQTLRVSAQDTLLSISAVLDPAMIRALLDN